MSEVGRPSHSGKGRQASPPVLAVGTLALGLAISGVTYLSSSLPVQPPMAPAIGLLASAIVAVVANIVILGRVRNFTWRAFFTVWRWTLLAYALIAGLLMFVFIYNHLPARQLAFMIATLAVFAVDVPLMLAFAVARHQAQEDTN